MHYFPNMSMKDILWGYSYANLVMLVSSIPSYEPEKKRNKGMEIKDIDELKGLL